MAASPSYLPPHSGERKLDAFEAIVREQQAGLRAFIRALGVEDIWVDDLAQETFIVAYRRWNTFLPQHDVGKWLRGIARNLVANERRKKARRARLLPLAVADVLSHHDGDDPSAEHASRLLAAVQGCVDELPERSRAMLRSRYVPGTTSAALGRQWAMTAEAFRQTLLRIRIAVKSCVQRKLAAELP